MSLKHRNIIICILILISATSWSIGQLFFRLQPWGPVTPPEFTSVIEETVYPPEPTSAATETTPPETTPYNILNTMFPNLSQRSIRASHLILSVISILTAVAAVFFLYPKKAFFGPDGVLLLLALLSTNGQNHMTHLNYGTAEDALIYALNLGLFLVCIRELWGWLRTRFSSQWYLLNRIVKRIHLPQAALVFMGGWLVCISLCAVFFLLFQEFLSSLLLFAAVVMGGICLWQYGSALQHFKVQLDHFQNSQPIEVREGAMAVAEQQLLDVQEQHREAVKAAVASERFKVDLISNVSHDLRTPLTAIVGYGELLQNESLSEEGTLQLARLNQKAGYMRELVDSLFELTKVSSGVLECRKENIDLIRLLEQTIGLMDDQLSIAGLTVKRHYAAQAMPLQTDGSRMHQVFANLLGNAIKYALPGTRIHLEAKETDDCITVRMVNTASYEMDFDPEEMMQRFARGDKARSTPGSGLGLAIAQTYTQSVGGTFRIAIDGDQFSAIVELPKN